MLTPRLRVRRVPGRPVISTRVLDDALADPESWAYIAHHAEHVRDETHPYGCETYSVLTRLIAVASELARLLA